MRAVVVGAVGSTEVLINALIADPAWEVALVVTVPPELRGRHSDIVDLTDLAAKAGANLHFTAHTNDEHTLAVVHSAEPDYIFVVGWSQLCGPEFLALNSGRIVGYHPAALPRLRGRAVIPWTILLDEKITAGSLFWLGAGTDDGDLIAQEFFHVARDETAASLYDKHMRALDTMLARVLRQLADGEQPRTQQDERYATYATKRTPSDGLVDWSASAHEIDRLVRAVGDPYPGAFTFLDGEKLTLRKSSLVLDDGRYHALVGQIVLSEDDAFVVQTGDGLLMVDDWKLEGQSRPRIHAILGR
ncbi:MAG: methionyl-tRNA formyltransferase [Porphyrobacter sp.]|nr:methionyl-tRNA formyltransferase [Porphyrobacter sp.]